LPLEAIGSIRCFSDSVFFVKINGFRAADRTVPPVKRQSLAAVHHGLEGEPLQTARSVSGLSRSREFPAGGMK